MLYNLDEICLIPAITTKINSRSECEINYNNGKLPLFTAPMHSTVFTKKSRDAFDKAGFNVIIPRTVPLEDRVRSFLNSEWTAFGLEEVEELFETQSITGNKNYYLLIDMANGHMTSMLNFCKELKSFYPNVTIMAGNIANPETYLECAYANIDYVRVSVGSGSVCSTTDLTGMYYPMGSLLIHMNVLREKYKYEYNKLPKIVADGGFKSIKDIIKALALGADYVMLGEILAKSEEASGEIICKEDGGTRCRKYFGMSTEEAQKLMNPNKQLKKSEGVCKLVEIKYSINDWIELFSHSLKCAMSYNNSKDLHSFIGNVKFEFMTPKQSKIEY